LLDPVVCGVKRLHTSVPIVGTRRPCRDAGVVRSFLVLRCSKERNALHTLIHQRHLTPSCGGHVPTAERTLGPARMLMESLTPGPELENSQDPYQSFDRRTFYGGLAPKPIRWCQRFCAPCTETRRPQLRGLPSVVERVHSLLLNSGSDLQDERTTDLPSFKTGRTRC